MKEKISEILSIKKEHILNGNDIINKISKIFDENSLLYLGSRNFDEILGGGFRPNKMYLIFGTNRTGKTQLCHQICIQAFKQFMKGGKNLNIKFLDTENTFRPERIDQLCKAQKIDIKEILKIIMVSKIMSNSSLLLILKELEKSFNNESINILIIDSINNYYRLEQGDTNTTFNQAKNTFIKILQKLYDLTKKFNIILIATAQVVSNFSNSAVIQELPVGLPFLNHFFSEIIYLEYKRDNMCFASLVNSNLLLEKKILYEITSEGLKDYKI